MLHQKLSESRILVASGAILLGLLLVHSGSYCAANELQKVRFHLYEENFEPVKVRIALDFQSAYVKLVLRKSDQPFSNLPKGFIEDFVIAAEDESSGHLINPVDVEYKNAKDLIRLVIKDHMLHLGVKEDFELKGAHFNYVPDTHVSYADLAIVKRTAQPKPVESEVSSAEPEQPLVTAAEEDSGMVQVTYIDPDRIQITLDQLPVQLLKVDTVLVEKIIRDTVFIQTLIHDTITVEKVVYIEQGRSANQLVGINCEHYVNWWHDPHFKLDFQFKLYPEELTIEASDKKLIDLPAGYQVKYVIHPVTSDLTLFHGDIQVNYVRCDGKIMLKLQDNKCYLLAGEGIDINPHEFGYDEKDKVAYVRLRY